MKSMIVERNSETWNIEIANRQQQSQVHEQNSTKLGDSGRKMTQNRFLLFLFFRKGIYIKKPIFKAFGWYPTFFHWERGRNPLFTTFTKGLPVRGAKIHVSFRRSNYCIIPVIPAILGQVWIFVSIFCPTIPRSECSTLFIIYITSRDFHFLRTDTSRMWPRVSS